MDRGLELAHAAGRPGEEGALRERLRTIALDELTRRRTRLGRISSEQERAIGQLLSATAERISALVIDGARASHPARDCERARALFSAFD